MPTTWRLPLFSATGDVVTFVSTVLYLSMFVVCLLYVRCCFVDAVDMCMYYGMFMGCFAYTKKVKVPLALIDDVVFTICLVECCLVEWHVMSKKGWHEWLSMPLGLVACTPPHPQQPHKPVEPFSVQWYQRQRHSIFNIITTFMPHKNYWNWW